MKDNHAQGEHDDEETDIDEEEVENNKQREKEQYLERLKSRPVPRNPRTELPENLEVRVDLPVQDFKPPRRTEDKYIFMIEPEEKEWERQIELGNQIQLGQKSTRERNKKRRKRQRKRKREGS